LITVAPHDEVKYKAAFEHPPCVTLVQVAVPFEEVAAVLTFEAIGPIKLTPIKIATKPPISLFIIVLFSLNSTLR
jgi:hypothetical protein